MSTADPFVSVVVPVYNGAQYLSQAVESIRQQAYEPLEIIIVDDGSTDGTAKLCSDLGEAILYVYQQNSGPSAARNRGVQLAHGDVICFLDVDDLWPKDKLKHQLACLMDNPGLEMVMGHVQCLRLVGYEDGNPRFELFSKPFFTFLFGAVLFKKSVFEKVGLLDERLHTSEDLDWFMRAKESHVVYLTLEQATLFYRIHEDNSVRAQNVRNFNMMKMLKKSLDRRRKQATTYS